MLRIAPAMVFELQKRRSGHHAEATTSVSPSISHLKKSIALIEFCWQYSVARSSWSPSRPHCLARNLRMTSVRSGRLALHIDHSPATSEDTRAPRKRMSLLRSALDSPTATRTVNISRGLYFGYCLRASGKRVAQHLKMPKLRPPIRGPPSRSATQLDDECALGLVAQHELPVRARREAELTRDVADVREAGLTSKGFEDGEVVRVPMLAVTEEIIDGLPDRIVEPTR